MGDTTPTIRWSGGHERDATSYFDDEAPMLQRRIGCIMHEYKLRLEKMQAEWEAVRSIQESNLLDKQKLAAVQRQELLRSVLVNLEADKNVHNRRCTCNHDTDSDDDD
jgi:hypothetical protein